MGVVKDDKYVNTFGSKCKRRQPQHVSYALREIVHILPVVPSRKRERRFKKVFPVNWGSIKEIEIEAFETLNAFDLLTLLSITSYCLESKLLDGGFYLDKEKRPICKMYLAVTTRYSFVKNYRGLDPNHLENIKLVYESILRLTDCSWIFRTVNGSASILKILMNFKEKNNEWHLYVNQKYIDAIKNKRKDFLKVNLNYMRKCKTDTGKLLCYWLQGQKNTCFSEKILTSVLHLQHSRADARKQLRKAFQDIKAAGYIKKWQEKEKDNERYFSFEKWGLKDFKETKAVSKVLESEIEDSIKSNPEILEEGLKLVRPQYPTPVGPIDILCKDKNGNFVVIELKRGKESDKVVGQIQRYMAWVSENLAKNKQVRGIIALKEYDQKLEYAVKGSKFPIEIKIFGKEPPVEKNIKYCPRCGKPNPKSAKYCIKCGKEFWM